MLIQLLLKLSWSHEQKCSPLHKQSTLKLLFKLSLSQGAHYRTETSWEREGSGHSRDLTRTSEEAWSLLGFLPPISTAPMARNTENPRNRWWTNLWEWGMQTGRLERCPSVWRIQSFSGASASQTSTTHKKQQATVQQTTRTKTVLFTHKEKATKSQTDNKTKKSSSHTIRPQEIR